MRRTLILAALPVAVWALHPSPAWPGQGQVYITEPEEDDGSIAWIIHDNQLTNGLGGDYAFSVEIAGEAIIGTIDNTRNYLCTPACPDTLVILDVPPGLAVVPPGVTTAEGAVSVLRVYEAVGF